MLPLICFWLTSLLQIPSVLSLPSEGHKDALLERDVALSGLPTTSLPVSTVYFGTVAPVQSASTNRAPDTVGSVHASLETGGRSSALPFNPSSISVASLATRVPSIATSLAPSFAKPTAAISQNVFVSVASGNPPAQISRRGDHPVKKLGIVPQDSPIHTNKFYANLFLGSQHQAVWTHPYSLAWSDGTGNVPSYGMSVSHIDRKQVVYGPGDPARYYINGLGIKSFIFSAAELGGSTVLTTSAVRTFSINVGLAPFAGAKPVITFPLVQGMGTVTAVYSNASVVLQSGVFFRTFMSIGDTKQSGTYKYRIILVDGTMWMMYVTPSGSAGTPPFDLVNSTSILGPEGFTGTIQIGKNPITSVGESVYDSTAGTYATGATISGSVDVEDGSGSYTITWEKGGRMDQNPLMFALPHHVEALDSESMLQLTPVKLQTTTKGMAQAITSDSMTILEDDLPVDIGFDPWSAHTGSISEVSSDAAAAINSAAAIELAQNISEQSNLDSMYYSGKALSKFATLIYATKQLGANSSLATAGLIKLKAAFAVFVENRQKYPLVYDTVWRGLVSSSTYITNDPNVDFGNTLYNDHHFHYGYFVHAASVIAHLDPVWLTQSTNKDWVNSLVRDFAGGSESDVYFPFSRSFDWYHGHSWAKGLFESADGKDEESTSEDVFAAYAVKMWGRVIGDLNMEARGNLQLAVLARCLRNYFLMESDNTNQPANFIGNKATGILFENKVDHTTYFGTKNEYIEGIHMLPIGPASAYARTANFVHEEWQTYFANGTAEASENGWRGILMSNLAIIDATSSWNYFSSSGFQYIALDGGASRTWYLAYAAALGGY